MNFSDYTDKYKDDNNDDQLECMAPVENNGRNMPCLKPQHNFVECCGVSLCYDHYYLYAFVLRNGDIVCKYCKNTKSQYKSMSEEEFENFDESEHQNKKIKKE